MSGGDYMRWHEDALNREHVGRLRETLTDKTRVLAFLGAGLSYGAARLSAKAGFEDHARDEGLPLPSWPQLISRMRRQVELRSNDADKPFVDDFFQYEGPLDCAELHRRTVGEQNYSEFLREQFDTTRHPFINITESHRAVMRLDLPLLFTTNYDQLLEETYRRADLQLEVSATEESFKANLPRRPKRHLVKMHGSIENVTTVVLTRSDYAKSRSLRREMFHSLRGELARSTFLFIGFSLSDPNFNLIYDDVRDSLGMVAPVCYTVQGRRDPVKQRYLESLGVNTIWLGTWNYLPDFLHRINLQSIQTPSPASP
jgi:hypothetical protein